MLDPIEGDDVHFENEPLERFARDGQLTAYRYRAFWQCVDTLRNHRPPEALWAEGSPPWKVWE